MEIQFQVLRQLPLSTMKFCLFFITLLPTNSTLFPYTTLFRSRDADALRVACRVTVGDEQRVGGDLRSVVQAVPLRSEEHTSELQSHSDLVCRLLLEKKKTLTYATRYEFNPIPLSSVSSRLYLA